MLIPIRMDWLLSISSSRWSEISRLTLPIINQISSLMCSIPTQLTWSATMNWFKLLKAQCQKREMNSLKESGSQSKCQRSTQLSLTLNKVSISEVTLTFRLAVNTMMRFGKKSSKLYCWYKRWMIQRGARKWQRNNLCSTSRTWAWQQARTCFLNQFYIIFGRCSQM